MEKKRNGIIAVIICIVVALSLFGMCSPSNDEDGGRCRFCGTHTNWTYKGGGYVCYSCYKKYY